MQTIEKKLNEIYLQAGISEKVRAYGEKVESELTDTFAEIDRIAEYHQMKVLSAMHEVHLSEAHLMPTTGYGYNDIGRDAIEEIYAKIFHTEDALVRGQITCGTHALSIALGGNLRPGDEILSPVGKPYDTLDEIIGIRPSEGSLAEFGITYRQVDLKEDDTFDYDGIKEAINEKTKLLHIQRSRGYSTRPTLSVEEVGALITFAKGIKPDLICLVDNCYCEFVGVDEVADVGADMVVGSLIKNPGGGLAPIGGYIAGTKECVDRAAYRLTAPGLGKELGASLDLNRTFLQGLFLAPTVTAAALKGAIFAANLFAPFGYTCIPSGEEHRYDIIQQIVFEDTELMQAFCRGIQAASPVDGHVTPVPWDMPGYDSQVIMAAGTFVSGASIELSADGPMKPPYAVYFQGGLTYPHVKFGLLRALAEIDSLRPIS